MRDIDWKTEALVYLRAAGVCVGVCMFVAGVIMWVQQF